jgi:hypothetical protein
MRTSWKRALGISGAAAVVLVGAIGFLHTKAGRPLLAALGFGCPVDKVTPAEVESLRQRALATLRGAKPAGARPAFGLALDVSTEGDVSAWASSRALACDAAKKPTRHLTCRNVPPAALSATSATWASSGGAPVDEVNFTFYPDGRLLGVETLRRTLTPAEAAHLFGVITKGLDAEVGSPTERVGDATADFLGGGSMRTAFARYRYSNFLGTVTAMNLQGRVALREQYQSAVPRG